MSNPIRWCCLMMVCLLAYSPVQAEEDSPSARTSYRIALPALDRQYQTDDSPYQSTLNFLRSFWQGWARSQQRQAEFVMLSREQAEKQLLLGEIDLYAGAFVSEAPSDHVLYSIPYIRLNTAAYRRVGEQGSNVRVAVHSLDTVHFGPSRSSSLLISNFSNLNQLLFDDTRFNYIYSWSPWLLEQSLFAKQLSGQYILEPDEARPLYVRVMVGQQQRALLKDINQYLRSYPADQASSLWELTGAGEGDYLELLLGNYLLSLPRGMEDYLIDIPYVVAAYSDGGYPPYIFDGPTGPRGYAIDLMEQLAESIGFEARYRRYPSFQSSLDALSQQQVELRLLINQTEQRQQTMLFTQPLQQPAGYSIVSRRDAAYSALSDLRGKSLAALRGYYENELFTQQISGVNLVMVDRVEQALNLVAEGSVDAFVGNTLPISYQINRLGLYNLSVLRAKDFPTALPFYIAISQGEPMLKSLLDQALNDIPEQRIEDLHSKWQPNFSETLEQYKLEALYRRIAQLGVALIVLMVVLIYWQRKVNRRRKVEQAKLNKALQDAHQSRAEAERLGNAKADFLARMSHEIRTPMNGVLGMAEALSFTDLSKQQGELLQVLNQSANNLMALLNDVLDFSKMDAQQLTLEQVTFELDWLVQSTIDNSQYLLGDKDVAIHKHLDSGLSSHYLGDPTRLLQVFNNLMSNAVKFTNQGSISISVHLLEEPADDATQHHLQVDVQDSGIGIAPERLEALFSPFVQAEAATTREFGGTGLGLSICRELIEAMGGKIEVHSEPGQGSLFSVHLQLAPSTSNIVQHPLPSNAIVEATHNDLRVLLVEDHAINRLVLSSQLQRLGIEADMAETGKQALLRCEDQDYDLILSDCHMPEMNGYELARIISAKRSGERPLLVAITAEAQTDAKEKCLEAGFDDYLAKPCPITVLQDKLQELGLIEIATDVAPSELEGSASQTTQPTLLNRQTVRDLSGGSSEIIIEVLSVYLNQYQQDVDALSALLQDAQLPELAMHCHRLKGVTAYLGAESLSEQAFCLEKLAKASEQAELEQAMPGFIENLAALASEVHTWHQQLEAQQG